MSTRTRIRMAASTSYGIALLIGIFTHTFVWVAIIGAVFLAVLYTALRGTAVAGGGRQRNRNRNRDRS